MEKYGYCGDCQNKGMCDMCYRGSAYRRPEYNDGSDGFDRID